MPEFVRLAAPHEPVAANDALRLLRNIDDRRAAPAIRPYVDHPSIAVRVAVVRSLGWSGDGRDVDLLARALGDEDPQVRTAARASLANIGGESAIDALCANLAALEPLERGDAHATLAWLGDRRDLDSSRELAAEYLRNAYRLAGAGRFLTHHGRGAMVALITLGEDRDRQMLIDVVAEMYAAVEIDDAERPYMTRPLGHASHSALMLRREFELTGHGVDAASLTERTSAILASKLPAGSEQARSLRPVRSEALAPRIVPRLTMRGLLEQPGSSGRPRLAKFGGQPEWIGPPSWPLAPDGHPMVFFAQFPTLDRSRMMYVFFADHDDNGKPLGDANAVVVQPGAPPQTPTRAIAVGPQLFHGIERAGRYTHPLTAHPYERFIDLAPGADPPTWEWPEMARNEYLETHRDNWCKLGGTPLFLQHEDWPDGDGWEFAFQFTAHWAGHEFGDVAECYGFVHADGRGAFLWQCH